MGSELSMSGRKVLVTGAAGGIGAACACALAAEGAAVALADVRLAAARKVARVIGTDGGSALALKVDVTDRDACRRMVKMAADRMGGLDGLVNNAITYGPRGASQDAGW
ncbi:MAG TPA: SDR family NAD(P)-dependent oxidoreductase, partial [Candidatus Brocadiia bacterium]|nr:SDR family NAD(P)-dependent oxidoreductase [Candidatus Brocadiia bacterium]